MTDDLHGILDSRCDDGVARSGNHGPVEDTAVVEDFSLSVGLVFISVEV